MPHLSITAIGDLPRLHPTGACPRPALAEALAAGPGPVILSVHGYRYAPGHPRHCPHDTLLSPSPRRGQRRVIGWPRHLGFGRGDPAEGLSVGFGWQARKALRAAHADAGIAGRALARLADEIAALAPDRPIQIVAHSLGARVALTALRHVTRARVGRMILLAGAAHASEADAARATTEIINVTTRENDLFDWLFEAAIPAPRPGDRALGHAASAPNLLTVQIDQPATLQALAGLGFRIAPPAGRVCHWSPYLRAGVFPLYRALLRAPESLPLASLRAYLPDTPDPRWSRLFQPKMPRLPLPFPRQAA